MAKIKIKQVDAFTMIPQTGNPAGVVLEGKNLSEQQMLNVARELNLPETLYILPSSKPGADLKMRWFSPGRELHVCGHSTIAGFHSLAEEGLLGMSKRGTYRFQVDTHSGIVPVDVIKHDQHISVMLEQKPPVIEKATQYKTDLVRLLDIQLSDFDNGINIVRNEYLYIGLRRLHTLFTMKPNFFGLAIFLLKRDIQGVCVYTNETVDRESVVHSRFFAPHLGSNEDSVTCSTHSSLALLLYEQGILDVRDGRCAFQGEQGDAVGRRGRVSVELLIEDQKPTTIKVGGNAITIMEGEMIVHD